MINKARNVVLLVFLFLGVFYLSLPNLDKINSVTGAVIGIFDDETHSSVIADSSIWNGLIGRAISDFSDFSDIAKALREVSMKTWALSLLTLIILMIIILFMHKYSLKKALENKAENYRELVEWIKKARTAGHSERTMYDHLIKNGWDKESILKAVKETENYH